MWFVGRKRCSEMKLLEAKELAEKWLRLLEWSCDRIEIAGSVRRGKLEVHDIEICAVPKMLTSVDLFGNTGKDFSALDEAVERLDCQVLKGGHKYKQLTLPEGINLDLFIITPPAEWGVLFLIRTGPEDFSHRIVTPKRHGGAMPSDCVVKDGAVWRGGEKLHMPEEMDFFDFLGMQWIEPEERK